MSAAMLGGGLFVCILISLASVVSSSAVNWNAQGPVKVEDVYSTENIPSASTFSCDIELAIFADSI
jgi:hypothetical protein